MWRIDLGINPAALCFDELIDTITTFRLASGPPPFRNSHYGETIRAARLLDLQFIIERDEPRILDAPTVDMHAPVFYGRRRPAPRLKKTCSPQPAVYSQGIFLHAGTMFETALSQGN